MAGLENFKLSELRLDQKNYRTGPTSTQREAITAIIQDQKRKLSALAEDILDVGLSPGEPIWVIRDPESHGMYVVLEGNRRITALKLMETPSLADGTDVEATFVTLGKRYAERPIQTVEGRVFGDREEAGPWQRRRHMTNASGVGLARWETVAKARANRDQGLTAPRFLAVIDFLQDETEEWLSLQDMLDSKWTTVDRVLNTASFSSILGVAINTKTSAVTFENGDAEAGTALLKAVLNTFASPDFKFSLVETESDRISFVGRFAHLSVKSRTPQVSQTNRTQSNGITPAQPNGPPPAQSSSNPPAQPAEPIQTQKAHGRQSTAPLTVPARTTLAPKTGPKTFNVPNDRLLSLYKECRTLQIKDNENAASFLLRVLIELSSEALLSEKGIAIPASAKGKTNWADVGITLSMKVFSVLGYLDPTGRDRKFQKVRMCLDPNSQTTSSISTLHGYFHNRHLKPDSSGLREAWDSWEEYLRLLHAAR